MPVEYAGYLPNVEPAGMAILGSISVEGDGLLANIDLTTTDDPEDERVFLGPQTIAPSQVLPALGGQQTESSTQPLPLPQQEN